MLKEDACFERGLHLYARYLKRYPINHGYLV